MNQKMELIRKNLKTPVTVTGSEILTGGIMCFIIGILAGVVIGMLGKGMNVKVAVGAYNGYGNHHNGCENQHNNNNNENK